MPPITGHAIFGTEIPKIIISQNIGAELIYSFIIILCSLMVYFGTKELYELSSHKGIKYFRLAFLFFAAAYFIRYFIKFALEYFNVSAIIDVPPHIFGFALGHATLFLFIYFSAIAVFYLLYSVMWKKWEGHSRKIYLFHITALIIAGASIILNNSKIYLLINLILLIFLTSVVVISHKAQKKKKSKLYIIYILLFIFWILNIIDILIPNFFQTFQLLIYLSSIFIFILILYKVLKKTGAN